MTRIFESAATGLQEAAPEFAAWIAAQVELVKAHCKPEERPVLRAYRLGHEYLACDYHSLSLTIRIDPDARMRVQVSLFEIDATGRHSTPKENSRHRGNRCDTFAPNSCDSPSEEWK